MDSVSRAWQHRIDGEDQAVIEHADPRQREVIAATTARASHPFNAVVGGVLLTDHGVLPTLVPVKERLGSEQSQPNSLRLFLAQRRQQFVPKEDDGLEHLVDFGLAGLTQRADQFCHCVLELGAARLILDQKLGDDVPGLL